MRTKLLVSSELRKIILTAGVAFVRRIVLVRGVVRVALVGSVTTDKPNPKDIDFLLTVSDDFDIAAAAEVGRKLKGGLQAHNLGADIFLCDTNHRTSGELVAIASAIRVALVKARLVGRVRGSTRTFISSD